MSDVACESLMFESMTWCWKDVWSSSVWRCFMMNDTHLNLWLGWIFDSIFIWRWSLLWFELIFGTKVHLVGNIGTKWGNVFIICTWTWINGSSVRMGLLFNMSSSWLFLAHGNTSLWSVSTRTRALNWWELILGTHSDVHLKSVKIFIFVVSSRVTLSDWHEMFSISLVCQNYTFLNFWFDIIVRGLNIILSNFWIRIRFELILGPHWNVSLNLVTNRQKSIMCSWSHMWSFHYPLLLSLLRKCNWMLGLTPLTPGTSHGHLGSIVLHLWVLTYFQVSLINIILLSV